MAVATGPVTPEASMISLLAALSVLSPTTAAGLPYAKAVEASDAPVRLWMNSDRLYREGSKVRVQVDSDIEGYLLVLNYDPDGRVRVLFPLDPRDDAAVHAGRRYEVRDDDGGQAFIAGVAGHGHAEAAGPDRVRAVRHIDVVCLGRADPVQHRHAERLVPAPVQRGRP